LRVAATPPSNSREGRHVLGCPRRDGREPRRCAAWASGAPGVRHGRRSTSTPCRSSAVAVSCPGAGSPPARQPHLLGRGCRRRQRKRRTTPPSWSVMTRNGCPPDPGGIPQRCSQRAGRGALRTFRPSGSRAATWPRRIRSRSAEPPSCRRSHDEAGADQLPSGGGRPGAAAPAARPHGSKGRTGCGAGYPAAAADPRTSASYPALTTTLSTRPPAF
jgi:hypothetical protein